MNLNVEKDSASLFACKNAELFRQFLCCFIGVPR